MCSKCLAHETRIPEIGYDDVFAKVCAPCFTELQQPRRRVALVGPEVRARIAEGVCTTQAAEEEAVFQHMYKCLRCDIFVCGACRVIMCCVSCCVVCCVS